MLGGTSQAKALPSLWSARGLDRPPERGETLSFWVRLTRLFFLTPENLGSFSVESGQK